MPYKPFYFANCINCGKEHAVSKKGQLRQCRECYDESRKWLHCIRDEHGTLIGKMCSKCKEYLTPDQFHKESRNFTGLQRACKTCSNSYRREQHANFSDDEKEKRKIRQAKWHEENKENRRRISKNSRIKKHFGIDMEQYENMLATQDGKCGLCGTTNPKGQGSFHIDHDHKTGKVRGLLCHRCNTHLGIYEKLLEVIGIVNIESWIDRAKDMACAN